MDRFIESMRKLGLKDAFYLKSNMDRFIAWGKGTTGTAQQDLKSNMDRFIVVVCTLTF